MSLYAQQRYYDPVVGRFLSIDPVGADPSSGGNFNRYWYANDNPYRFTDPDGRQATGSRLENSGMRGDLVHSDRPDSTLRVQESRKGLVVTLDDVQDIQMEGAEGGFDLGEIAMQKALMSLGEPVNLSKEFIVDTVPDFAICASICAAKAFIGEDVVDVVVNLHEKAVLEGAKKGFTDAGVKIGTRAVRAFNEIENTANSIRTAVCTATECL